ncbi:MAG: two component regulator propeller domain protein [Crocinitomicaceae bacterium]|jgi:photosystem II stability/assembly factor-like uncharacterized protein|nr:two component regulator propeller domain protein [Crocinitomicaceae bacterium]
MKKITILCCLLAALWTGFNPGNAQWELTKGPEGSTIRCFAFGTSNVYAGTNGGGLFQSSDNGTNWNKRNNGMIDPSDPNGEEAYVNSIATFGVGGTMLMAGTNAGAFLSSDNGLNWTNVTNDMVNPQINDLLVLQSGIFAGTAAGMEMTSDNGATWIDLSTDISGFSLNELAATDFLGSTIFAATSYGIYSTSDLGLSWTLSALADTAIGSIVVKNSTTIFASTMYGIFRSTNGGTSWENILVSGSVNDRLLVHGNNIYCSIYGGGIFRSTDNGDTWAEMNTGLQTLWVTSMGSDGTNLYAGTAYNNAYISNNGGSSWNLINTGLTHSDVLSLAAVNGKVFAGTFANGLAVTSDNGNNWDRINSGLPMTSLNTSWDIVYTLVSKGTKLFAGVSDQVFVTTDNGASWNSASTGLVTGNNVFSSVLAGNGIDLYVGTLDGIYKSSNDGASWAQVGLAGDYVYSLMASGTDLFAGAASGVYRSSDNGASWQQMNTGLPFFFQVYSLAKIGTKIFAGSSAPYGVYVSTDNGASWSPANTGITSACAVTSLAVSGNMLIASTGNPLNGFGCAASYVGVFVSDDFGASWTDINQGLDNYNVRTSAVGATDLFIGTTQGGVWKRPLSQLGSAAVDHLAENEYLSIYPNPVSETLTVKTLGKNSAEICNIEGRLIRKVELNAGESQLSVSDLEAGVYLLKFDTQSIRFVKQ